MNNRRRLLVALGAGALVRPVLSFAQQATRVYRIGVLGSTTRSGWASRVEAMQAALRDLGYVAGRNVIYEERWSDGKNERLPELAAELVRSKCDVLVTSGTTGILALKGATTTVPIVMASSGDAVGTGLVESLAHPGGNVTGMTFLSPELAGKRIEMLKEIAPRLARVGYLNNPDNRNSRLNLPVMEKAASSLHVKLELFANRSRDDFEEAFAAMAKAQIEGVVVGEDVVQNSNHGIIAKLALDHRLPSAGGQGLAENGGLIGYGTDYLELFRRAAAFVDKILKGAKPADLPVEQPIKFALVINMKTAKALGIKIPDTILVRAEKVIE